MSRLLFWLALAFLVLMALRSKWRSLARPAAPPSPAGRPDKQAEATPETMLCCARCQVYYPASETVTVNGRDYCSAAHASLP